MRSARHLLWLAILLSPLTARAQPLFHFENEWTVTIGGKMFGVREAVQTPGDFRRTQVWLGWYAFDTRLPAAIVATLALVPLAIVVIAAVRVLSRLPWKSLFRRAKMPEE